MNDRDQLLAMLERSQIRYEAAPAGGASSAVANVADVVVRNAAGKGYPEFSTTFTFDGDGRLSGVAALEGA